MNTTSLEYHRGDIFYANLEPHLGCEQGGIRPVLVLQNNVGNKHSKTLIVSALTSRTASKAKLPIHVFLDYIADGGSSHSSRRKALLIDPKMLVLTPQLAWVILSSITFQFP